MSRQISPGTLGAERRSRGRTKREHQGIGPWGKLLLGRDVSRKERCQELAAFHALPKQGALKHHGKHSYRESSRFAHPGTCLKSSMTFYVLMYQTVSSYDSVLMFFGQVPGIS